jgi:hypothetical protein
MGSPLNPPKGDFDYVLLRVATNSRIVFIVKILFAPLSWTSTFRGLGVACLPVGRGVRLFYF